MSLLKTNCIICGSLFEKLSKTHPNQKHCSKKCIKTSYRIRHKEKDTLSKRVYAAKNREKHSIATNLWRKQNPGYYRQYTALRTRMVKQAQPKWLSELDFLVIAELYDLAAKRNLEVDHIIPIKHKLVCGLHVPQNLQLLSRSENARKSNKFTIDEDLVCVFHQD